MYVGTTFRNGKILDPVKIPKIPYLYYVLYTSYSISKDPKIQPLFATTVGGCALLYSVQIGPTVRTPFDKLQGRE